MLYSYKTYFVLFIFINDATWKKENFWSQLVGMRSFGDLTVSVILNNFIVAIVFSFYKL